MSDKHAVQAGRWRGGRGAVSDGELVAAGREAAILWSRRSPLASRTILYLIVAAVADRLRLSLIVCGCR
jgi:hypothetical protein